MTYCDIYIYIDIDICLDFCNMCSVVLVHQRIVSVPSMTCLLLSGHSCWFTLQDVFSSMSRMFGLSGQPTVRVKLCVDKNEACRLFIEANHDAAQMLVLP